MQRALRCIFVFKCLILYIICLFCTLAFLQTLKYVDRDLTKYIELISENVLNAIVKDKNIDVDSASELCRNLARFLHKPL